jgi:hypothetical protein
MKVALLRDSLNLLMRLHIPPPPHPPPPSVRPSVQLTRIILNSSPSIAHRATTTTTTLLSHSQLTTHSATTTTHISFTNIAPMSDAMLRFEYSKHSSDVRCDVTFRIFEA